MRQEVVSAAVVAALAGRGAVRAESRFAPVVPTDFRGSVVAESGWAAAVALACLRGFTPAESG